MAKKTTLEQKKQQKRPPYQMAEPNDDLDAYGWRLAQLRFASKDSTPGNVWPGRPIFMIPQSVQSSSKYGHEAHFLCPKYLQLMLDRCPEIRKGAEKARAAGYSPEALKKFTKVVLDAFDNTVLVDIATRFHRIAPMVAGFYAAQLAHIDMFGSDEEAEAGEADASDTAEDDEVAPVAGDGAAATKK